MRPVLHKSKFSFRHIIYIAIALICIITIGATVYFQFFRDEKIGVIFGITEKEEEEYNKLKEGFINIFTNDTEVLDKYNYSVKKIKTGESLIAIEYEETVKEEKYESNIKIPYFNIDSEVTKTINKSIKEDFNNRIKTIKENAEEKNVFYSVKYKGYIKNDIISLIILSELKEENSSQRIMVKTYNYNLKNDKEMTIGELLKRKNLDTDYANKRIKEEIENSQMQNAKLSELGYKTNIRDANSSKYNVKNAESFFIGQENNLYIIYAYGNDENTSEMDIVIL